MATIDKSPSRRKLAEARSKVRHPLSALRGYIRGYVTLEGVAFFLTFVFLWFWIGLLIDYVLLYKVAGVDYVRWLPFTGTVGKILRIGVLGGLVAWLLTKLIFVVVVRLFRDFSDAALALLLERRYPDELGDRLITAVELSDPEKAAEQGYSAAMVEETIQEASDRVRKLPVRDVFDWGRLFLRGLVVLCLSVVGYFLAVGLFHVGRPYQPNRATLGGFGSFHDVATILVERNVLLKDTPWPREVQVVQLAPDKEPLRIGSNQGRTTIRYRALKYVLASPTVEEGWEPLLIKHLQDRPHLLAGVVVPTPPGDWKGKYNEAGDLSLDEAELLYARLPVSGNEAGDRWTFRELGAQGEVERPLLWADLSARDFGGVPVRTLPPEWDQNAPAAQIASVVGALQGPDSLTPLAAAAVVAVGPVTTAALTVDQVAAYLSKQEVLEKEQKIQDAARLELLAEVRAVFSRLRRLNEFRQLVAAAPEQLQRPELSREVRILTVPDQLDFVSNIRNSEQRASMPRSRETNEFSYQLNLPTRSETVTYQAEYYGPSNAWKKFPDYATPTRTIEVIGPPQLINLYSDELQPAYLYYRWGRETQPGVYEPDVKPIDLAGKKQRIDGRDRLNPGSNVSRLEVPAGTDLTLRAKAERPLSTVGLTQGKGPPLPENVQINGPDGTAEFTVVFPNLRTDAVFSLDLVDTNGVKGSRNVVIKVSEDSVPDLPDHRPSEIIRKSKEGLYMITPDARIPFTGSVIDDRGLSSIRYAYTVEQVELIPNFSPDALPLYLSAFVTGGIQGQAPLNAVPQYLTAIARQQAYEAERLARIQTYRTPTIPGLLEAIQDPKQETDPFLTLPAIKALLPQAMPTPYRPMVSRYTLVPDYSLPTEKPPFYKWNGGRGKIVNDFPVETAQLKGAGNNQPRYKLQLWVEGVDTDVEGARDRNSPPQPHVATSKDRFTFLVVPEFELLLEINRSEGDLNFRLIQLSRESGKSWDSPPLAQMEADLGSDLVQLSGNIKTDAASQMGGRIQKIRETLLKGQVYCQSVLDEYRLLLLEMEINRIAESTLLEKQRDVVKPLEKVIRESFPRAQESMGQFEQALFAAGKTSGGEAQPVLPAALATAKDTGNAAQTDLRKLRGDLEAVIQALEQAVNLAREIERLKKIADRKEAETQLYERIHKWLIEQTFGPQMP